MNNTELITSTVEAAREIAKTMRRYAESIDRCATRMDDEQDLTYALEVMSEFQNCFGTAPLNRLISRPLKGLLKETS